MTQTTIEGFIIPKHPAKRPRPENQNLTNCNNKFASLQEVILPNPSLSSKRPPPIFMKSKGHASNLKICSQFIKDSDYTLSYKNNGQVRVQTRTISDFQALKTGLKDLDEEFHSFSLKSEKPLKSVIKGLPSIPIEEIKNDLISKGFSPLQVFLLKGKNGQSTKAPIYMVHFVSDTNIQKIKEIKSICHCIVTIEKYNTKNTGTQCFRCQDYGHAATNCNRPHRCVKCAGNHATASCIKEATTAAKCCNCGGSHTANFSQCPAKISYIEKTSKVPSPRPLLKSPPQTTPRPAPTPQTFTKEGFSWAQITKGPAPATRSPMNVPNKIKTSADMPINDLMQLVLKVRELQIKLKSCSTQEQRMYLIMELAMTMDNV
jgi:hypothetical protein